MEQRYSNLHQRISDYSRCPYCVTEQRTGFATAYFNFSDKLFAVCGKHAVKWVVTGRGLLHPNIPDLSKYAELVGCFRSVDPAPEPDPSDRAQALFQPPQDARKALPAPVTAARKPRVLRASSPAAIDAPGIRIPGTEPGIRIPCDPPVG
jgi:hypothetical protein